MCFYYELVLRCPHSNKSSLSCAVAAKVRFFPFRCVSLLAVLRLRLCWSLTAALALDFDFVFVLLPLPSILMCVRADFPFLLHVAN